VARAPAAQRIRAGVARDRETRAGSGREWGRGPVKRALSPARGPTAAARARSRSDPGRSAYINRQEYDERAAQARVLRRYAVAALGTVVSRTL